MTARFAIVCDECGTESGGVLYPSSLWFDGWVALPATDPAVMNIYLCPQCALDGAS